ncbi:Exodeoxyribonuclease VII large subunit [hydrothermal vent metagenome]|uniref:Exodeoxyribonuclease VII large subunit n=1 Tax=hydrothermal vent metagenome TaxID=652676 RepID=A0A1W1BQX8_9ZZZZ
MNASPATTFSLDQLYEKVTTVISDKLSLFQGLTLSNISIDKNLKPHDKWQYSFYIGTSKSSSKNYTVQLKISNTIINKHRSQNGEEQNNAKYDIEIDTLSVSTFGAITVTVKSIKETGVSERELLRRRLEKFTKEQGYDKRTKKALPRLVTSILALTSKFSEIHDDLHSNLNLSGSQVRVVNCTNSKEISQHIQSDDTTRYDIVVLYRGGREDEAMNMFSSEEIIEAIAKSDIPVCAALGHDMDTPFIYAIADQTYSTPSAFGKAITAHNHTAIEEHQTLLSSIGNALHTIKENMEHRYTKVFDHIEATSKRLYEKVNAKIDRLLKESENNVMRISDKAYNRIASSSQKIEDMVHRIYKSKIEQMSTIETAIGYYMQDVYRNKVNHINLLADSVEQYGQRIEANIHDKQALAKERKSKQKTFWLFATIIAILIAIIAWLVVSK